jgi:hypothetical protein
VVLIEGPAEADIAQARLAGFQEVVGSHLRVQSLYGRWEDEEAERVLTAWLSSPGRKLDVVACPKRCDGPRRARRAQQGRGSPGRAAAQVGARDRHRRRAQRRTAACEHGGADGDRSRTRARPARAIELLAAFWKQGARTEHQVLKARSLPPLDQLKAISEP